MTDADLALLRAVHQASGDGNPRAKFYATAKRIAAAASDLQLHESAIVVLLQSLVDAGFLEMYTVKRRFTFTAYRLTAAGETAIGLS